MSINIPKVKPELLKSLEADFGSTIARKIYKTIVDNIYYAKENFPLGMIKFFYQSQPLSDGTTLIDPPNPDIWIKCDGGTVDDPLSPFNGFQTIDPSGLFLKGGELGQTGGSPTFDWSHDHGGWTGYTNDINNYSVDGGGKVYGANGTHRHSIGVTGITSENAIPPYVTLVPYMRYK